MTGDTVIAAGDMGDVLADRHSVVMAVDTGTYYLVVVHGNKRQPSGGGVAGVTRADDIDVIGAFAGGRGVVVTGVADAHDAGIMLEQCRHPGVGAVAVAANVRGLNMVYRFTLGKTSGVAVGTDTQNLRMVDTQYG